jgi:hypothetical protein
MTREVRQRDEISAAFARGDLSRALVLAREHLLEFPNDSYVRGVAERAARLMEERSA